MKLFLFLFLFSSIPAVAANPTAAAVRQQIRQERGELRGTITQERKEFWSETRKKRLEAIYTRLHNRLASRFRFLSESKNRLQSRIAQLKTSGKDLSAVESKLAETSSFEALYVEHLAAFDAKYQQLLTLDQPLSHLGELQSAVKAVRDDLNSFHRLLLEAVQLIIKSK